MNKTINYGLVKPPETDYYDIDVQNSNMDIIDAEIKKTNDNASKLVEGLKAEIKDNELKPFESDVLLTNLTGCNGGFVNVDNVKGKTLVNLSKFTVVKYVDGYKQFVSSNDLQDLTKNRTLTLVNNTGKEIVLDIFENDKFKRPVSTTKNLITFSLVGNEVVNNVNGYVAAGWTELNKNDLLNKVMILDGEVKVAPNQFFEGMAHVGELIGIGDNLIDVTKLKVGALGWGDGVFVNTITDRCIYDYFIPVEFGKIIIKNRNSVLFLFDSNKNFIGVEKIGFKDFVDYNTNKYTVENGVVYVKVVFSGGNVSTLKDAFIKYGAYRIEILSKDKNLSDINNIKKSGLRAGYWHNAKTLVETVNYSDGYPIRVIKGQNLILSASIVKGDIQVLDSTGTIVLTTTGVYQSSTTDILYMRVRSDNNGEIEINNIMLENSNIRTPYSNNSNKTEILMQQPLREWDILKNNGDVDRVSKQYIINGSEVVLGSYQFNGTNTTCFKFNLTDGNNNLNSLKCDKLKVIDISKAEFFEQEGIMKSINGNSSAIYLRLDNTKTGIVVSDTDTVKIQKVKTYLSNNNVSIVYQLSDSAKVSENSNKTLILDAYENGNLQVNCGVIQGHVEGTYSTKTGERLTGVEGAINSLNIRTSNLEKASLVVAGAVENNTKKIEECFQYASDGKNAIATAITNMGVKASGSDTFPSLASKIVQIYTGKKFASGTTQAKEYRLEVTNLNFKASFLLLQYRDASHIYFQTVLFNTSTSYTAAAEWEYKTVYINRPELFYSTNLGFKVGVNQPSATVDWIAIE